MLFSQTFYDRDKYQCCANKKRSKCHAIYTFSLCKDDETDECPQQHDAGHLEFG